MITSSTTQDSPSPMENSTNDFIIPLPLSEPKVRITCPRLEDAADILPILNDPNVYIWMGASLPYPHELKHSTTWLWSVRKKCEIGQHDVQKVGKDTFTPEGKDLVVSAALMIRECPVRIIRERIGGTDVYLGDIGLVRWKFSDIVDNKVRGPLIAENESKLPGDSSIIWTIGYYLKPSHHGKGIMKVAVATLLNWARRFMNVTHLRTTAMEDNIASIRVLESNGFKVESILPGFAYKAGIPTGLAILELKY